MAKKKYKATGLITMEDNAQIKDPIIQIREIFINVKYDTLTVTVDYLNDSKQVESTLTKAYKLSMIPFDATPIWEQLLALPQHSGATQQ